jgi:NitT/TauT family transport system ATP-binding protein
VAAMTDVKIKIEHKAFNPLETGEEKVVISNLDITLKSGEFVCLAGPSGCGKTTLLNILSGLDNNFQGSIELGQSDTEPTIGYVFQNPRLLPWRTVRENLELATQAKSEFLDSLLAAMKLTSEQQTYPEQLSLGMSRRVSIIRAFANDPDILLMDEPFVSLDPPTARQVRQLLIKLWTERPHTVLFVTHDLREAITLADRLIFLSDSPMSVITEIPVSIPRDERQNEAQIESFRSKIFTDYPEVLGLL